MNRTRLVASGALAALAFSGCGSGDDAATSATLAPTSTAALTTTIAATSVVPATAAPTVTSAPTSTVLATVAPTTLPPSTQAPPALMPDVLCMNLQDAQNAIQDAGVFFSRSEDATGRGRNQVIDSNWQVVSQAPSPGSPIGEGEAVLSVVKYGEPSPCP